MQSQTSV